MVEAPEKPVGRVRLVSVLRSRGGVCALVLDSKDNSWTWVARDSEEERALKDGEEGEHSAHSIGRT